MLSRPSLELRQSQQLALTPQLQQSIRFLQLSAHELEAEVALALEENPLLERDEEYDTEAAPAEPENHVVEREYSQVLGAANRSQGGEGEYTPPEASLPETLSEHLLGQLRLTQATDRDRALVALLIGELDENGYLTTSLESVCECLPPELGVGPDSLRIALRLLQSFDPRGVGATSLSDCLLLQLEPLAGLVDGAVLACAGELARHHLALLASGNLNRLREALSCTPEQLRAAHSLLLGLDPKPGRAWAGSQAAYVNPEIIVRKAANRWRATLNTGLVPRLRVNALYERWLREHRAARDSGETTGREQEKRQEQRDGARRDDGLQGQLQNAHGLVKSVAQRFETILRVAEAVVEHQQAFFGHGPQAMRPLLLRDIAAQLDMHESTVSRATRHKYMQTPWGVFELKYFFGTALDTEDGDSTSATAVHSMIRKLIEQERPEKPLSDSQLAKSLAGQGVVIARRTVAKYREAAGIETAMLRKARAQLRNSSSGISG